MQALLFHVLFCWLLGSKPAMAWESRRPAGDPAVFPMADARGLQPDAR
jgi:hypothetical protein